MTAPVDSRPIRALILDDCPVNTSTIANRLAEAGWTVQSRQVTSAGSLGEAITSFLPDVVLAAPSLQQMDAHQALATLAEVKPGLPMIVVGDSLDARSAIAVLRAGAEDVVALSENGHLARAVDAALQVRSRLNLLSPRQRQVLALVARGNTSPEIATQLNISVKTVETHRAAGMRKLGLGSRVSLVRFALAEGWLQGS